MSKENKLTIAEKQTKLAELLRWFESDDFSVEQATAKLTEAEKLTKEIETELMDYQNEITLIKQRFDQDTV